METFNEKIKNYCYNKNNNLCIGLDVDNRKLKDDSIDFMKGYILDIIDATIDMCPIYKINFAFYERLGFKGFKILELISSHIGDKAIKIADAKRGDIGNSSKYYSEAILDNLDYDAITVSPYMGEDSISPFIENKKKGVFILCLTSNKGSENFQHKKYNERELYNHVAEFAVNLNHNNNIGLVVGATQNSKMLKLKEFSKNLPWLMPGVGFQGGNLEDSIKIGSKNDTTPIINVSRGILTYKNGTIDDIAEAASDYTKQIRKFL